jgi:hypothetical protein
LDLVAIFFFFKERIGARIVDEESLLCAIRKGIDWIDWIRGRNRVKNLVLSHVMDAPRRSRRMFDKPFVCELIGRNGGPKFVSKLGVTSDVPPSRRRSCISCMFKQNVELVTCFTWCIFERFQLHQSRVALAAVQGGSAIEGQQYNPWLVYISVSKKNTDREREELTFWRCEDRLNPQPTLHWKLGRKSIICRK